METDPASDSELIQRYLAGDEAAFECLYNRHKRRLYGYLNSLLPGQTAEADEIFQLAWIRVIDQLKNYRDHGCFPAWLFRLARNILIDRVRHSRREGILLPLDQEEAPPLAAPAGSEPWRQLDETEVGGAIRQAIAGLPPEQREVFLLRSTESMPFREIAQLQHCSINTVLARMQYALKNLRNCLAGVDKGGLIL